MTNDYHPCWPWYDNAEGIENRIRDLAGLRQVLEARSKARAADDTLRLKEWVILGRFWIDQFAQCWLFTEGAPADDRSLRDLRDVMPAHEATRDRYTSATPFRPPGSDDRCERCGRGWTIRNAHDVYRHGSSKRFMHVACRRLQVVQTHWAELCAIVDAVEIPGNRVAIPSQYHSDDLYFGPWMIVESPRGRIEIGWRKRVISIDWKDTAIKVHGKDVVACPEYTHWERGCHAYGSDEAVECLRRMWSETA